MYNIRRLPTTTDQLTRSGKCIVFVSLLYEE